MLETHLQTTRYYTEQRLFEEHQAVWEQYVQIFEHTYGRRPVIYDLYCGEGGYSRGARAVGVECYGFDINPKYRERYESEFAFGPHGKRVSMGSGMRFTCMDLDGPAFWDELTQRGRYGDLPPPDLIHASPPCSCYTKLNNLKEGQTDRRLEKEVSRVDGVINKLQELEVALPHLVWQVENVPESKKHVESQVPTVLLCGTMMGHYVIRHRLFYCNFPVECKLPHEHSGKVVGSRGMNRSPTKEGEIPNMYGVYSRRYEGRGSYDEWHGALGHTPGTFSREGIVGVLPMGYGRLLTSQMVARSVQLKTGLPIFTPSEITHHQRAVLQHLAERGCSAILQPADSVAAEAVLHSDAVVDGAQLLPVEETTDAASSPYHITASDQLQDPWLSRVCRMLKDTTSKVYRSGMWTERNGLLYYVDIDETGRELLRQCVPSSKQHELMHQSHHTADSGHRSRSLYSNLSRRYYWFGMKDDCEAFVLQCKHCNERAPAPLSQVKPGDVPMPSLPFHTLHIDHKADLIPSGPYRHILVVVDALTRYTLYIPVEDRSSVTTFRALFNNVFCVFGRTAKC